MSDDFELIQRDLLIYALFGAADRQGLTAPLVHAGADGAEFALPGGGMLAVFSPALDSARPGSVERRARALVEAHAENPLSLVLVGGTPDEEQFLATAVPSFSRLRRKVSAFRIDEAWRLHSDGGSPPTILEVALHELRERAPSIEDRPLSPEVLQGMVRSTPNAAVEEEQFAKAVAAAFPWVTVGIAAVCVTLHGLAMYWGRDAFSPVLWRLGANSHERVVAGEWWRLVSSSFLHGNLMHLGANMLALASFGPFLERVLGRSRYVVLYMASGLAGSLASVAFRGEGMSVGASGAIWGLMAAGAAFAFRPQGLLPPLTLAKLKRQAGGPVIINFIYSFKAGIDLFAHFGGGLAGFALVAGGIVTRGIHPRWNEVPSPTPTVHEPDGGVVWHAAAILSVVAVPLCLAAALTIDRPWEISNPRLAERTILGDTAISVRPPRVLGAMRYEQLTGQGGQGWAFGSLDRDSVAMEIRVSEPIRPDELPSDGVEREAWLRNLLGTGKADKTLSSTEARMEPVRSGPAAARDFEYPNGVHRRMLVRLAARRLILVDFYSVLPEGAGWASLANEMLESVQGG